MFWKLISAMNKRIRGSLLFLFACLIGLISFEIKKKTHTHNKSVNCEPFSPAYMRLNCCYFLRKSRSHAKQKQKLKKKQNEI